MSVTPTSLQREGVDRIQIQWSDGSSASHTVRELRDACPCATCTDKHGTGSKPTSTVGLPVLSLEEAQPLSIKSMQPVGNYAYNIAFSDGHDSGIFTFEYLYSLGEAN